MKTEIGTSFKSKDINLWSNFIINYIHIGIILNNHTHHQ